ncbi:MAG: T9SS type A sorting domain-containing protein, partial [Desulfobacterales bacterium]|nr:T9SS type A sorting domain-containing protein [Desulfobacterales bacterium]
TGIVQKTSDVRNKPEGQKWWIQYVDSLNSEVKIKSIKLGKHLSYSGTSLEYTDNANASIWKLLKQVNGTFKISDKATGKMLSTGIDAFADSSNLVMENNIDNANYQEFYLVNTSNFKTPYKEPDYPPVTWDKLQEGLYIYLSFDNHLINYEPYPGLDLKINKFGSPLFQTGKKDKCLVFNGSTDYLEVDSEGTFNPKKEDFTISLWSYNGMTSSDKAARMIVQQNNGLDGSTGRSLFLFETGQDAYGSFLSGSSTTSQPGTFKQNRNKWTHLAVICNSTTGEMTYMINGKIDNIVKMQKPIENCTGRLLIGRTKDKVLNKNRVYKGKMDEFYMYKRALNPAEVRALMNMDFNVGIEDETLQNSISIVPNPASSQLDFAGNITPGSTISIRNINGSLIMNYNYNNGAVDISNLSTGMYLVTVENKNYINTMKLIISR